MAIAFVQQVGAGASVSGQTTFTSTATTFTAGNLLVAVVWWSTSTASPTSISTPAGWTAGTFQKDGAPNGGGNVYYMPNNPGGSQSWAWTVTLGSAASVEWSWAIYEFSGVATTTPIDLTPTQTVTGASSSATHDPGAAVGTTQAGDLLISLMGLSSNSTTLTFSASASSAPTSGWSVGTKKLGTATTPHSQNTAIYQIVAGTQASPDGIITSSATCSAGVWLMTFKAAGAVAASSIKPIYVMQAVNRASVW